MGVKKNFGYNLILTFCSYLFPLITYPYVSRVLGVQNIGVCNFVDSIINYFVLFSMLGVGSYGVREIARVRLDVEKRNFVFSNLIVINLLLTIVSVIILIVCTYTLSQLANYKPYLLIGIAKLVFNMFLIEWFYQGMQNFRYITIRSLLIKIVYVITIFVFVHDNGDVLIYFFLTVLSTIINAIVNWIYARKFVVLKLNLLDLRVFIIPVLTFGYYRILTSMYTTFNTVFLGFTSGDVEVGYFTTATKLYAIIMSVLSAFTTVMIPKVSELLREGKTDELQWIADQTLSLISVCCIPIIIYCQFCAADIIQFIAGIGYEGAIIPFRIVIFMLLIIGFEQILIQQFLMAGTKNKPILIVSTFGAIIGLAFNLILTPSMCSIGSAIAWCFSEIVVLVLGIFYVKQNLDVNVHWNHIIINLFWAFLYVIPLYVISQFHLNMWMNLVVSGFSIIIVFLVVNLKICLNPYIVKLLNNIKLKKWHCEN